MKIKTDKSTVGFWIDIYIGGMSMTTRRDGTVPVVYCVMYPKQDVWGAFYTFRDAFSAFQACLT